MMLAEEGGFDRPYLIQSLRSSTRASYGFRLDDPTTNADDLRFTFLSMSVATVLEKSGEWM
jgi:hypothetical protein